MKTATVRQLQHNLREVLDWIERGEEVRVTRHNRVVARIVPPVAVAAAPPDFVERARSIWGRKPRGKRLSEVASAARGDR